MAELHTVILAGGSGTRFWPLSRRDHPKQFLQLGGSRTLLQQSFDRLRGLAGLDGVWVVTNEVLATGVTKQLADLHRSNLIVEPQGRDTAVAMGLAAGLIAAQDPSAVLAITPSDHLIRPATRFRDAIKEGAALAEATPGRIVTFGIPATEPRTAYGYIHRAGALKHGGTLSAHIVEAFCEKPDAATAQEYVAGGEHSWNSGIFVWRADTLLDALATHLPATREAIDRIVGAWGTSEQDRIFAAEYSRLEKISIDYAVLEKASDVVVLEADFEWSDVGSWTAITALIEHDAAGNAVRNAPFVGVEAKNCLVQGDGRLVAVLGLDAVCVIQTRDATLVCPVDRAEDVKKIVAALEANELEAYT